MQSPPRLKLIVIAPVGEDILVRCSHFHLLLLFHFYIGGVEKMRSCRVVSS